MNINLALHGELSMIVRRLSDLIGSERDIDWGNGRSRRLLVEHEGWALACATRSYARDRNLCSSTRIILRLLLNKLLLQITHPRPRTCFDYAVIPGMRHRFRDSVVDQ